MSTLIVENRAGQRVTMQAQASLTLMDIMRDNGVEEILISDVSVPLNHCWCLPDAD